MKEDRAAAERAIAAFLEAIGHGCSSDPELEGTPARVTEAFVDELLGGYRVDTAALLENAVCETSEPDPDGLIVVSGVRVQAVCPHHLLPGLGTATVAYLPGPRLLGIGALARLLDAFARRLTLQETIGREVVAALMGPAQARGAYCRLDMHHTCLSCRGARQLDAVVTTTKTAGQLATPEGERQLHRALAAPPGPTR